MEPEKPALQFRCPVVLFGQAADGCSDGKILATYHGQTGDLLAFARRLQATGATEL